MSADNWATCPVCLKNSGIERDALLLRVCDDYGKVRAEEYLELVRKSKLSIDVDSTLREDYEFYMDSDGTFTARYACKCDECGFRHSFSHTEQTMEQL